MAEEIIKITGLEDVQRLLSDAPKIVAAAGYANALRAGIDVFAGALELTTPVRTGELKDALTTTVTIDANAKGGTASVGFGAQSHRAMWVEYGHRMVGHKPGKKRIGDVPAHPFMRPVFDSQADVALEAVTDSLSATVQSEYKQETK